MSRIIALVAVAFVAAARSTHALVNFSCAALSTSAFQVLFAA